MKKIVTSRPILSDGVGYPYPTEKTNITVSVSSLTNELPLTHCRHRSDHKEHTIINTPTFIIMIKANCHQKKAKYCHTITHNSDSIRTPWRWWRTTTFSTPHSLYYLQLLNSISFLCYLRWFWRNLLYYLRKWLILLLYFDLDG